MAKSYSSDLRKKVVEYILSGKKYDEASKVFKISISAIGRWNRKYKKEGVYEAKQRGGSRKKIDLQELQRYVESNENMTLKEAAARLKVSTYTISYWLKSLGYSYKKKTFPTWKRAKRSEKNIKI